MTAGTTATAHLVLASYINVRASLKLEASAGSPRTVLSACATSVTIPVSLELMAPRVRRIPTVNLMLATLKANVADKAKEKIVYATATAQVKTAATLTALVDRLNVSPIPIALPNL